MFPKNNYRAFFMRLLAFAFFITGIGQLLAQNKLVYCICNPRSSLVELLRMMGERGDFKVMHIPANWAYCNNDAHNYTEITKGWYREDAPSTYAKANEDILKEAESGNVFVGENTHTAKEFLEQNPNFIKDSRLKLILLVSNPHASIISYYKKKQDDYSIFDKMPTTQLSESIGLKGIYDLLMEIKKNGGNPPLMIKSEDLYLKTQETVQSICDFLQIPFKENSLHWKDLSSNFSNFADYGWYTIELTDCAKKWHGDAIKSTGFTEPATFAVDARGNPTFEEVVIPKHRELCIEAYKENAHYYKLLFETK